MPSTGGTGDLFARFSWAIMAISALGFSALVVAIARRKPRRNGSGTVAPKSGRGGTVEAIIARQRDEHHAGEAQLRALPAAGTTPPIVEQVQAHSIDDAMLTLPRLRELEWKRFELIVARYFGATGKRAVGCDAGPDGGIDVRLYHGYEEQPFAYVQCKARTWVGPKAVRELLGVMAADDVQTGYLVTTGDFTADARNSPAAQKLVLVDGSEFVRLFNELEHPDRDEILKEAYSGDFRTPSCPSCNVKLVLRSGGRSSFWGCSNFPRCRYTLKSSSEDEG